MIIRTSSHYVYLNFIISVISWHDVPVDTKKNISDCQMSRVQISDKDYVDHHMIVEIKTFIKDHFLWKMLKVFCSLIVFVLAIHPLSSKDVITGNISLLDLESINPDIIDSMGGMDQLKIELKNAMRQGSSMRNGLPVSLMEFHTGSTAIIAKICFPDDICWTMKMYEDFKLLNLHVQYGINAMTLIHQYCPNVPIPKFKGCNRGRFLYCFTEWIEGQTLVDKILSSPILETGKTSITIPQNVVVSLAEFVYNVTTCPIPENLRKKIFSYQLTY